MLVKLSDGALNVPDAYWDITHPGWYSNPPETNMKFFFPDRGVRVTISWCMDSRSVSISIPTSEAYCCTSAPRERGRVESIIATVWRCVWRRDIPTRPFSTDDRADISVSLLVVQSARTRGERSKTTIRAASSGPSFV